MIAKVCPKGRKVAGLLRYLYSTSPAQQEGRGRRNPHVGPRVVAGFDDPAVLEPSVGEGGRRDFRRLVSLLEQPLVVAGVGPDKRPVYHLVVAAKKDPDTGALVDRYLSDEAWGEIAGEYVHQMGLAPRGDDLGARWVAVRHADDHIHVVVTLARQDGRRVFPRNDFWRAGEASRAVEEKYGLSVTAASDRTAAKRPSYAETAKAERQGDREPVRDTLRRSVRTAAAGSSSLGEFLDRLRTDGVMVRERFSERTPGQVTGYSVALPGQSDPAGKPIYFGGGKLAADLTLPKLLRRWELAIPPESAAAGGRSTAERSEPVTDSTSVPAGGAGIPGDLVGEDRHRLTPEERDRIWEQATAAAATATEQVTAAAGTDPNGAADAAWAASDFLSAAARVVEGRRGGPLTAAAGEYDRAARELWGRVPQASGAGKGLRAASVLLASARFVGRNETKQLLALLAQLAALSDAVTRLRESQDRAVQAAAARRAAEGVRVTSAQRTSVHPGSSATTAPRTRRPEVADDEDDRRRQRPPQGPPHGPRRGPRL